MLVCVSISHRTAGLDLLDRLSAATAEHSAASYRAADATGAVLLSTCNRIEAYLDVPPDSDGAAVEHAAGLLAEAGDLAAEDFAARSTVTSGPEALRHLFAVTAGLESLAVGEEEIAGQVKRAYDAARTAGTTSPEIDRAFQRAQRVSREVRTATAVGQAGRSLVQFALELAGHRVGDWRQARVLIVGTGNYAATTIANLRTIGVRDIAVYSATGRAAQFGRKYGIQPENDLAAALVEAEVVITCTKAYTVTQEAFPLDGERRIVIDLGVPHNVDPEVAKLQGVDLIDLGVIATHANLPELAPDESARDLVRTATDRYTAEQLAAPSVVGMRQHVFDLLDRELERVRARAESPEAAEATAEAMRHLVGVLLHLPAQRARDAAAVGGIRDFEAALAVVYGIDAADFDEHNVLPTSFVDELRRAESA